MLQRVLMAALVLAIAVLGLMIVRQGRELERLGAELDSVRTAVEEQAAGAKLGLARRSSLPELARPAPVAVNPAPNPVTAPAPSVRVSREDVDRVEGALLELLEADHPALRERLRAVVQEQHQTMRDEQHEARRERWVTRREARLLELSQTTGITAEQRASILSIQLANRDQVEELRRSAQTVEEVATLRDRVQRVREQGEAQIRAQLNAEQYEAYKSQFDDD